MNSSPCLVASLLTHIVYGVYISFRRPITQTRNTLESLCGAHQSKKLKVWIISPQRQWSSVNLDATLRPMLPEGSKIIFSIT